MWWEGVEVSVCKNKIEQQQIFTRTTIWTPTLVQTALTTTKKALNNNYYAILDSGASDNYIMEQAPVSKTIPTHDPIQVTIPDGTILQSTN